VKPATDRRSRGDRQLDVEHDDTSFEDRRKRHQRVRSAQHAADVEVDGVHIHKIQGDVRAVGSPRNARVFIYDRLQSWSARRSFERWIVTHI
jgi:hypothetical protein